MLGYEKEAEKQKDEQEFFKFLIKMQVQKMNLRITTEHIEALRLWSVIYLIKYDPSKFLYQIMCMYKEILQYVLVERR